MKLKEYLDSVPSLMKEAIRWRDDYNSNELINEFIIEEVPKLLRLVEIMSGALKELNRRQFAGCGTCPSGLQEHQQIAQDARVECERILSE